MVSQFVNSRLIVLKFLIFFFNLVYCKSDNVDHVSENGSSYNLYHCYKNNLNLILRS